MVFSSFRLKWNEMERNGEILYKIKRRSKEDLFTKGECFRKLRSRLPSHCVRCSLEMTVLIDNNY